MTETAFIDGQAFPITERESILQFATRHQTGTIPTLCDDERLEPYGACRLCSVDVALTEGGPKKVVASCHTPIQKGMRIETKNRKIQKLRKNIMELVLTDHPLDCVVCGACGNCELQDVAAEVGIEEVRYAPGKDHQHYEVDDSHPYLRSELSKCINCSRCLRACDEIQGEFVLAMAGRGFDSHIIKGLNQSFNESPCVSCGQCAQTCPTGAISDIYQPGTVMADKKIRTICSYCGVGCNLEVLVMNDEVLSIRAPEDAIVNAGHTCVKGRYAFRFYNHPDRLDTPLLKVDGKHQPISWEEALAIVVEKFSGIKEQFGSEAIAGISSSRCTNEENYLMQKFMRAVIGNNNIAQTCPTGAISDIYQPGTVMADKKIRTICSYCGVGRRLSFAGKGTANWWSIGWCGTSRKV